MAARRKRSGRRRGFMGLLFSKWGLALVGIGGLAVFFLPRKIQDKFKGVADSVKSKVSGDATA